MVPARKIRSACLRFLPGHWALSMQNLILLRFTDTPGFAEPTPPVRILTGGPRASPTQFRKVFLRTVGEGLKVNRPKAERSHPGVCPYENNTAATISAVGATLAVACTPGANPGGHMLCAPTGFRWTVGAAISRPSLFPHGERTIPPIRGKCPEGTKGVGGHGEAVTDEGALLDRNPYSNGRAGEGTRPYGENRTVAVGSAEPGAVVEPQQRQFLQTQGPVARMEPQKVTRRRGGETPPVKQKPSSSSAERKISSPSTAPQ